MISQWVTCPVSGQRWAQPMRQFLRSCTACGGLVDTRTEAWLERGSDALHWPGRCPVPDEGGDEP